MHVAADTDMTSLDKPSTYATLARQMHALLAGETDRIANYANFAALVFNSLPDLNWAGFYLLQRDVLVLGPFQGKPACVRIPVGQGVCGTAAQRRTAIVVPDVQVFPGHITCDSASQSELVVPLIVGNELIGVFDLDSPKLARFDAADATGIEGLLQNLSRHLYP
jgi:GAF domain-containing protein